MRASTVPTDHWHHGSTVADGQSYVRLSGILFSRPAGFAARFSPEQGSTSRVQTLVYELGDLDKIGVVVDGQRVFCCTDDLVADTGCETGSVIVMRNGPMCVRGRPVPRVRACRLAPRLAPDRPRVAAVVPGWQQRHTPHPPSPACPFFSGRLCHCPLPRSSSSSRALSCGAPRLPRAIPSVPFLPLLSSSFPPAPSVVNTDFVGNDTDAAADDLLVPITRDGLYYLWFINCNDAPTTMTLRGKAVFKNPTGYLPGGLAPHMPFFGALSLVYCLLGLAWLASAVAFWRDLILLQGIVAGVIGLCVAESAAFYFDYVAFNATGFRPAGATIVAILISVCRKTVGAVLVLITSMGYGVVRPTLVGLSGKVLLLGGSTFGATAALDVALHVGNINDFTASELLLVLPVAVLDAITVTWSLHALAGTLAQLKARQGTGPKLVLYQRFALALVAYVAAALAWMGYEYWFRFTGQMTLQWQVGSPF